VLTLSGSSVHAQQREKKNMSTKKQNGSKGDDMRPEYDFSQARRVRGKYYERAMAGTNLVLIEPEVFEVFSTGEAVNAALRTLIRKPSIRTARHQSKPRSTRRRSR